MSNNMVKSKKEENNWKRAKSIVERQYPDVDKNDDKYYKLVMTIYKKINEEISTGDFSDNIEDSPYRKDLGWSKNAGIVRRGERKRKNKKEYKVFDLSPIQYLRCKNGKEKYQKYNEMLGEDDVSKEIKKYAKENPDMPIIVREAHSGDISFLRYGKHVAENLNNYKYQI